MNTYIIAEVGQAHDGSIGILHSYIDAIAEIGVDAVKFQTHIADAESSQFEKFRVKFSYKDKTRYDYWKRMEMTLEEWVVVKKHCENVGLDFISTPFSCAAVDLLENIGVSSYKIGSGDVNNLLLLSKICKTNKDIIISSGMSSQQELDIAVSTINNHGNKLSVLHCTTEYPTPPEKLGLNLIASLKKRYDLPIGLSDHSGIVYTGLAAVALGAEIYESHVVFNKRMFGPDSVASLDIKEFKHLVKGIKYINKIASNTIIKDDNNQNNKLKKIFGKSLAVNKNISKGHILTEEDLESKKPCGKGIPVNQYRSVIGGTINKSKKKYDFLLDTDVDVI
jgi:N-acetylneuraminate synthase